MRVRRQFGVAFLGMAALALLLGGAGQARAEILLTMTENAAGVTVSGGGTAVGFGDAAFFFSNGGSINPSISRLIVGDGFFAGYDTSSSPPSFGPGGFAVPTGSTGDFFGVFATFILLPADYMPGATLSGTSTYAGQTFSSLGVTPGTYVWRWGSGDTADSLTLQIGAAAVPEPASLTSLGIGAVGLLAYGWRRRPLSCSPK
jgi:hypothetical protein